MHVEGDRVDRRLPLAPSARPVLAVARDGLWTAHGDDLRDNWEPAGAPTTLTVPAKVQQVIDAPCGGDPSTDCRTIVASVEGREVKLGLSRLRNAPSVSPGDSVRLTRGGGGEGQALGVAVSLGVLLTFMVPAILARSPALLVALVASLAVMFVTLVLTNGLGVQTLAAALGVSMTLALTCVLALLAVGFAGLDGTSELDTLALRAGSDILSLQGVILAAMLIGALGVLADTAVTQASAAWPFGARTPATGLGRCIAAS